jgi:hypothetical protein
MGPAPAPPEPRVPQPQDPFQGGRVPGSSGRTSPSASSMEGFTESQREGKKPVRGIGVPREGAAPGERDPCGPPPPGSPWTSPGEAPSKDAFSSKTPSVRQNRMGGPSSAPDSNAPLPFPPAGNRPCGPGSVAPGRRVGKADCRIAPSGGPARGPRRGPRPEAWNAYPERPRIGLDPVPFASVRSRL